MDVKIEYDSPQNEQKYSKPSLIKKYYDRSTQDLVYLYCDYDTNARKNYSDIDVEIYIAVRQEETYEKRDSNYKLVTLHKYNKYSAKINYLLNDGTLSEESMTRNVRDVEELTDQEEEWFIKGFQEKTEFYKDFYGY